VATPAATTADVTQARLQLRRATVVRLMEWQARAVAAGLDKPSYSELVDGVIAAIDLDQQTLIRVLGGMD
jgi:hypothetical protein